MYHGVLSRPTPPPAPFRRPIGRRGFLLAGLGFALGAITGGAAAFRLGGLGPAAVAGDRSGTATPVSPAVPEERGDAAATPEHGSLDWALAMTTASDEALIAAAGDLERVTARHRDAVALEPLLVRILTALRGQSGPDVDTAGACAIRSLVRIDRAAVAVDASAELADRDLPGVRAARERAQAHLRRSGG